MSFFDLLLGASTALAATSIGALGVILLKKRGLEKMHYSLIIAFCAGVMTFSAFEMLDQSHALSGDVTAILGFATGVLTFFIVEKVLPHAHMTVRKSVMSDEKKKAFLIAGTITIHNIPEGFAIASAFASATPLGWLVTTSIALQDIPEGLLVSTPLACYGIGTSRCMKYGVISGIVEFIATIIGYIFLNALIKAVPFALAFSAGAMLYVVVEELLPDAFRTGTDQATALSLTSGIVVAFILAMLLGF